MRKKFYNLFTLPVLLLIVLTSCGGGGAENYNGNNYVTTFVRSGIVTKGVGNVKKLRLFYNPERDPSVFSYDNGVVYNYSYNNKIWSKNKIVDGINGAVDFQLKDNVSYILNWDDETFNLYVKSSNNIAIENLTNKFNLFGKITGSSIVIKNSKIYLSYIINESAVYFAYRAVTGGTWKIQSVNVTADNGSGFYVGDPTMLVNDNGEVFISYYDGSFGQPEISEQLGNKWNFLTIDKSENSWMDFGSNRVMFFDNHGELGLFYNEKINGQIYYSDFVTEVSEPVVLDDSSMNGKYMSGGILGEIPYLFYFNGERASLKLIYRKDDSWHKKYVRTMGISGMYVDSVNKTDNIIGVVYIDLINDVMIFQEIGSWQLN